MRSLMKTALAAGIAALAVAGSAQATTIDFTFANGGTPVAAGSFSYNSSGGDVVGYNNLTAFAITVAGVTYDTNFVQTIANDYVYFDYDPVAKAFVPAVVNGSEGTVQELLGAFDTVGGVIEAGFIFTDGPTQGNFTEITSETFSQNFGSVNFVPEPATLALLGAGLAGLGVARRRRTA